MTRMIERWFPGPEVSANSRSGWGSGNTEVGLMTWFAKRPTAQARAAVLCSLLPWPDDSAEQARLQQLVHDAMTDRFVHSKAISAEIERQLGDRIAMLDPFSGRGMIPLEAARLGLPAYALDYSWVAVLASRLLADYTNRNWDHEPALDLHDPSGSLTGTRPRLVGDASAFINEVGRRHSEAMAEFYPAVDGRRPWGYLWALTIPCRECGRTFPLIGSLELRKGTTKKSRSGRLTVDEGQSFAIETDRAAGTWSVRVHDGPPLGTPTRQVPPGKSRYDSGGKLAVCPFCGFGHDRAAQMEVLAGDDPADTPLLAADIDSTVGKRYRQLQPRELDAAIAATDALRAEASFSPLLPARPDEPIPDGNTWTVQATVYGAVTYGDMMNDRQTLSFIRLARTIAVLGDEVRRQGASDDYVRALTGYAAAALARKLRRATRGCVLAVSRDGVSDIFQTESSLNFSFDYFEVGLGGGPGSWESVSGGTLRSLETTVPPPSVNGHPVEVSQGSATALPFRDGELAAVVTDPPYDAMIDYSDASDLFYVWLKRALVRSWPELAITAHPNGVQEKDLEIIVKKGGTSNNDHRDRRHYDTKIAEAFSEMRRVVADDGVVTIVFGHGEPEVWQRLLAAIDSAGLVLTGAWPAKTEAGGKVGFSNIVSTLTMACRPAPVDRPLGRKGSVESEIREEIRRRYPDWERWGLAPADMLMAAAGPAMEVVGRYSEVRDSRGERVDIHTFLPLARAAVQEAMAVEIDHRPLEAFDARTRFALWWVRLYEREPQAKSELRWQALASSLDMDRVKDLVPGDKSAALVTSDRFEARITPDSAVIDVALALAAASEQGLAAMGEVLVSSSFDSDDQLLWAAIQFLADRLPDSDPDAIAFHRVLRARGGIGSATENVVEAARAERAQQDTEDRQIKLL
jgi:putative DNA methylase